MSDIVIRPKTIEDTIWIEHYLDREWGSRMIVTRGLLHDATGIPAFVAEIDGERIGLATYRFEDGQCELLTLNSDREKLGVGTALVKAVRDAAIGKHCARLWLVTTNDNLHALQFYQRRGFKLACLHRNAIHLSRQLKPSIPEVGLNDIPIRDEIELEIML